MTKELVPISSQYEKTIWTIDEYGESVRIPVAWVNEYIEKDEYSCTDSMRVEFDKGDDDE